MKCITDPMEDLPRSYFTIKMHQAMGPHGNLVRNVMRKHLSRQVREAMGTVKQQIQDQIPND